MGGTSMAWSPPADLLHRITDVVEARGGKRSRGDEWRFTCPSHDDEHASADWNAVTGVWHCMACDAGGGALDLARQLGVDVPSSGAPPTRRRTRRSRGGGGHPPPPPPPAGLPDDEAWARLVSQLVDHDSDAAQEARDYLTRLGIDPAETGWGLSRLTAETAQTLGLGRGAVGLRYVIPIRDPLTGQLVDVRRYAGGFETSGAKCLPWRAGSGDTRPYGWDRIADAPVDEPVIWVEGEKDCETLRALGHLAVSHTNGASSGRKASALVPDELLLNRRIVLWFDHDRGGEQGAEKLREALRERGVTTAVMEWPAGTPDTYDVSDLVLRDGPEAVGDLVRWRIEVAEWDVPPAPRAEIIVTGTTFDEKIDAARQAVQEKNTPVTMFLRSGELVEVSPDERGWPVIRSVNTDSLRDRMARAATWLKLVKSDGDWKETPADPPKDVAASALARPDQWDLPALEAVLQVPTLRPDGSLLCEPGYDAVTKLYYSPPKSLRLPKLPAHPSPDEARAALLSAWEPLSEFPYVHEQADQAGVLALLLTPVLRGAIDGPVPLALIDAPQPGTGKSLLAEVVGVIATGTPTPFSSAPRQGEEPEWRKLLTTLLMAGSTIIGFDNVEDILRSGELALALTAPIWQDRTMGRNDKPIRVPVRVTWLATGNNLRVGGDVARRCYRIQIDAKCARPQDRAGFKIRSLRRYALEERGNILAALLTAARGWFAAGQPDAPGLPQLGSFEEWRRIIGGILAFCGFDGFLSNITELSAEVDPDAIAWCGFLEAWLDLFGEQAITTKQLADIIDEAADGEQQAIDGTGETKRSALAEAVPEFLLNRDGRVNRRSMGKQLDRVAGRRYPPNNLRLERAGEDSHSHRVRWIVLVDPESQHSQHQTPQIENQTPQHQSRSQSGIDDDCGVLRRLSTQKGEAKSGSESSYAYGAEKTAHNAAAPDEPAQEADSGCGVSDPNAASGPDEYDPFGSEEPWHKGL